jgi:hypothetical protein
MKSLKNIPGSRLGKILATAALSLCVVGASAAPTLAAPKTTAERGSVVDSKRSATTSTMAATAGTTTGWRLQGCSQTINGSTWRVTAEVKRVYLTGTSYRWIETATNVKTELFGATAGTFETNAVASATIASGGASIRISGSAVIHYTVLTPWGEVEYKSTQISCSVTFGA